MFSHNRIFCELPFLDSQLFDAVKPASIDVQIPPTQNPFVQVDEELDFEDPLVAAGVLSSKHAETRAFMTMAGKQLPSENRARCDTAGTR